MMMMTMMTMIMMMILYSYRAMPEPDLELMIPRVPVKTVPLTTTAPDPQLRVDVYYECLCPDSR